VAAAFHTSLNAGITFFDTAEIYGTGTSELSWASLPMRQIERIDLYQIHFPSPLLGIPALMDATADAVAEGKIRAVGVSNYSAAQMHTAHAALARHSASNKPG
jgi:aryl-alcohol dehydrogenase-like predicted oxidoreductase